jgi:sugar O-acyltransferase (sialic acid O-acetyltransferase NeuD family)
MDSLSVVLVPLVNPNENESILAQVCVKNGQQIRKGDLLAVFETTKSTLELTSEREGFILGLSLKEGDSLTTGQRFCYIVDNPDAKLPEEKVTLKAAGQKAADIPEGLRITQPALKLARQHKIDLATLPLGTLITETLIKRKIQPLDIKPDPTALIIYGGGGHAKSLIDLIRAEGKFKIAGILDDGVAAGTSVMGIPVLGNGELLAELRQKGIDKAVNAVGGIGSITPRLAVYEKLKAVGFSVPTVVHPRAFIESSAKIGEGGQVFFNAYVGSEVEIGFGCIVNTGAIVSHDCILGDYVNISPGAILAGAVTVKERSLVGMGVTINLHVTIGAGARVGNSAVIKADVPNNTVVHAGSVWPVERA